MTPEHRAKISAALRGRVFSNETRAKMRAKKVTGFRDDYPEIPLIVMMRPQIEMLESSARAGG